MGIFDYALLQPKEDIMRMRFVIFLPIFILTACNSVYVKPESVTNGSTVYVELPGFAMRHFVKDKLRERGYRVVTGKAVTDNVLDSADGDVEVGLYSVPSDAQYSVRVKERQEIFAPVWCAFNGLWWMRFNMTIANQTSGEEIMSWFGYGCVNSSIRKFDKILDKMERK